MNVSLGAMRARKNVFFSFEALHVVSFSSSLHVLSLHENSVP